MAKAVICVPNSIWLITYQWPTATVSKTIFSYLCPIGFYIHCEMESERQGLFGRGGTGKAEGRWEGGEMCPTARHSWAIMELSITVPFGAQWMVGRRESQRKRLDTASIPNPKKMSGSLWGVWGCGKATLWKSELQSSPFQRHLDHWRNARGWEICPWCLPVCIHAVYSVVSSAPSRSVALLYSPHCLSLRCFPPAHYTRGFLA